MSELEGGADLKTIRAARCRVAIEDDFGADAWWQLSLELDQQAPDDSIVRACATPVKQVVPVDQDQLNAVQRPSTAHVCPSIGACCCWSTWTALSTADETRSPVWRRSCASAPPKAIA